MAEQLKTALDSKKPRRRSDLGGVRNGLSFLIVAGFFGVLFFMLLGPSEVKESSAAWILLGALGAAFTQVIQFHFGSSSGSERKSDLLAASEPSKEKSNDLNAT